MLGLTTAVLVHVVISLIAIGAGFVVLFGLLNAKRHGWTGFYLATTLATTVTGFLLPADRFLPSHAVGIATLLALAIAIPALYVRHLEGRWRSAYVVTAGLVLYFNVFVLVVQSFLKVPTLKALAPTQTEAPFAIAQGLVLVAFIGLITLAVRGFRVPLVRPAQKAARAAAR